MTNDATTCTATTKRGLSCTYTTRPGRTFCEKHDPELSERRRQAMTVLSHRRAPKEAQDADASLPLLGLNDVRDLLQRAAYLISNASSARRVRQGLALHKIAKSALVVLRLESAPQHFMSAIAARRAKTPPQATR